MLGRVSWKMGTDIPKGYVVSFSSGPGNPRLGSVAMQKGAVRFFETSV